MLVALAACVSVANDPVAFELGSTAFFEGDAIVIDAVRSSTGDFRAGAELVVSGHYTLSSRERAVLYFGTTSSDPLTQVSAEDVPAGSGSFQLAHVLPASGRPHLSFYDKETGKPFGGVSFGTGDYLRAAEAWDADAVVGR